MYYIVPINNGDLDIDYKDLIKGHVITDSEAIVSLKDDAEIRSSWIAATQADWDLYTAPSLAVMKGQKKAELLQAYYASFISFQSSATGALKTYPADAEAQQNLKDYEQRLIANPNKDSFWFKTIEDSNLINHTREQFLQLMEDAEAFKVQQTQKFNDLANQVDVAEDESVVNAIVW